MAVKIGSARSDENGKATGGKAGDQNGREVSTQDWYKHSKKWIVLRALIPEVAELLAYAMERACANNRIGYDQYQRNTLYELAKACGFDPGKVIKDCETDCSALVRVCLAYAGIHVADFNTSTEVSRIMATGKFEKLADSKYTDKSDYLQRGDILVTATKGHTVVVLTNGSKVTPVQPAPPTQPTTGIKITGGTVNIRSTPDSSRTDNIVLVAKAGQVYPDANPDDWYAVEVDGKIRFVSKSMAKRV